MTDESNLEKRVRGLEMLIEGPPGEFGLRSKVEIIWRSYIAAWTLAGTFFGVVITLLVTRIAG